MVDFTKPVYGDVWANTGEKLAPDSAKIATGWIQEMMPYQYENFLQNRTDTAITYLLQKGVAEWSSDQEYIANKSVVTYGGQLYMATATTTNVLPTVTASWKKLSVSFGANGAIPVSFGGTGATTAVDARTNLGIGSAATANLPAGNGMLVKLTDNTLVARSVAGTTGYITVTNGDGVAGNPTINVGANVAKTDADAAWTTTASIRLPAGSTAQRGTGAPGRIRFNLETGVYEGYDNTGWNPIGSVGALDVQNFQGDGVRTTFTLSSTPRAENNTQVYFNGVYQQKNTYNLVGNDLVFDEAPTSDISIEVVNVSSVPIGTTTAAQTSIVDSGDYYNSSNVEGALQYVGETLSNAVLAFSDYAAASAAAATLPDGQGVDVTAEQKRYKVQSGTLVFESDLPLLALSKPGGSGLVGFTQVATGAIARTIQDRLRQEVDICDFGAKPVPGFDNTTAIRNAIAYAQSLACPHMIIPSGSFEFSDTLRFDLPDYSTISCFGKLVNTNTNLIVAVAVGSLTTNRFGVAASGLKVVNKTPNYTNNSTALQVVNVVASRIGVDLAMGFGNGLVALGSQPNGGVSYCRFDLGMLVDNTINLVLLPLDSGYVNENTFYGGSFNHSSSFPSGIQTYNIYLVSGTSNPINSNVFIHPSLEDNKPDAIAMRIEGVNNFVFYPRLENPSNLSGYPIILAPGSQENTVLGGYGVRPSNIIDNGLYNTYQTMQGISLNSQATDKVLQVRSLATSSAKLWRGLDSSGTETSSIDGTGNAVFNTAQANSFMSKFAGVGIFFGSGSPEGVLTASIGSIYVNAASGTGQVLYVKQTGFGNTGWVLK